MIRKLIIGSNLPRYILVLYVSKTRTVKFGITFSFNSLIPVKINLNIWKTELIFNFFSKYYYK